MVEFYDPDRRSERPVEAAAPPARARVEGPPPSTSPSSEAPALELVLIGVAVLLGIVAISAQGATFGDGLGLMLLFQFVYPLTGALLTAAVVSLLLRRPLRRQRAELSAELSRLHAELATLRAATAGDGR